MMEGLYQDPSLTASKVLKTLKVKSYSQSRKIQFWPFSPILTSIDFFFKLNKLFSSAFQHQAYF